MLIRAGNCHNVGIVNLVTTKEPMMKITMKIDQFDNTFKTSQQPMVCSPTRGTKKAYNYSLEQPNFILFEWKSSVIVSLSWGTICFK
jgi:hypothetical protein